VYRDDIERLLLMSDMWNHRKPPHSLDYDELEKRVEEQKKVDKKGQEEKTGIQDQRKLSLEDSFELFCDSYVLLCSPSTSLFIRMGLMGHSSRTGLRG